MFFKRLKELWLVFVPANLNPCLGLIKSHYGVSYKYNYEFITTEKELTLPSCRQAAYLILS